MCPTPGHGLFEECAWSVLLLMNVDVENLRFFPIMEGIVDVYKLQ